jgi:cob(I)alamin adenosyltransferase
MTIQTSDQGAVEVTLSQNANLTKDAQYIEVVGKVDEHGESIKEYTCLTLGDSLGG